MIRINDYILASRILEILCYKLECDFVDCEIEFYNEPHPVFKNDIMFIPKNLTLPQVFWAIVSLYINNIETICNVTISSEDKISIQTYVLALIRDFSQKNKSIDIEREKYPIAMRLDQFHLTWILMRSIISPLKGVQVKNYKIIAGFSPFVDSAVYVCEENSKDMGISSSDLPLIYVNLDIESVAVREAFVFFEAIRASGLNPDDTIREIFGDFFLQDRLEGLVSMAFADDEDVANFFGVLSLLARSESLENLAIAYVNTEVSEIKTAQQYQALGFDLGGISTGTWWFMGLTEKMLGSVRGSDWTAHEQLKHLSDDLWNKVEKVRKERRFQTVPFETLLRIQSEQFGNDGTRTLQGLLADQRVW